MNIAFDVRPLMTNSGQRGIGNYIKNLLLQYVKRGDINIQLMYSGEVKPALAEAVTQCERVKWLRVPKIADRFILRNFGFIYEGLFCRAFYRRLAQVVDLIHFTSPQEVIYGFPWFDTGAPRILTVHDIMSVTCPDLVYPHLDPLRHIFSRSLHRLLLRSYRRSDAFICDSAFTLEELKRFFHGKIGNAFTVLLGSEPFALSQSELGEEAVRVRAKYSLPENYFLYVGGLAGNKNVKAVFEALSLKQSWPICLAGPHGEDEVRALRSAFPNVKAVWLGYVDQADLDGLYGAASAFVFPSLMEGFGLPVIEAMARGVPVICSDAASLPEAAGGAALMFDPYSVEALSSATERLAADRELRTELKAKGLKRAEELTWKRCADNTIEAYQRICADYKSK
ncbi:glycosyltransferase family 4 protein [bacterium]|nr:glycosyltransferase family 4 protein [bacterium]